MIVKLFTMIPEENEQLLNKKFNHLGPEPFSSKFSLSYIYSKLKGKQKNIKNFLIDQSFVSGIGNIYASEILFLSRINPTKKAKNLRKEDYKKILINSKKILSKAIKSAIKRIRRIAKQTAVNKARKSRYKNAIKKMNLLIDNKKKSEALKFLPKLNSELMKVAKTGIIKKQNASRNVSRITRKISTL